MLGARHLGSPALQTAETQTPPGNPHPHPRAHAGGSGSKRVCGTQDRRHLGTRFTLWVFPVSVLDAPGGNAFARIPLGK